MRNKYGLDKQTMDRICRQVVSHRARARTEEHVSAPLTVAEWREMLIASDGRCSRCGLIVGIASLELDHVFPMSQGGAHAIDNVAPLCKPCNAAKSNRLPNGIKPKYRNWDEILKQREKQH